MFNGAIKAGGEKEWGWRGPSCQLQIACVLKAAPHATEKPKICLKAPGLEGNPNVCMENSVEDENQATADNTEHSNDSFHTDDVQSPTPQDNTSHGRRFSASTSRPRPTLLKRMTPTQQATLTGELLQTVNEHFKRPRPSEDRHDIFGKNVANVLREVLVPQRILAEKFINDVLFHAQISTLTSSHGLTKVPRFPQHHEVPLPSPGPSGYHLTQSASAPNQLSPNNDSLGGRKTKKPPVYQQLTQLTRTPTELSPYNDADEGITASRFVSSYLPDDEQ
ncbi:hypothetical protein J6590_091426 [Homalodisca vitripennis]|nr:hypothetical protein J6590_091426 [Homalodisca vitripennis]